MAGADGLGEFSKTLLWLNNVNQEASGYAVTRHNPVVRTFQSMQRESK